MCSLIPDCYRMAFFNILAIFYFAGGYVFCMGSEQNGEPLCLSRYDYDYKMLSKVVAMETELRHLQETLKEGLLSIKENKETVGKIESSLSHVQKTASMDSMRATYVRWGRTSCPENGTELVYEGYVGGSSHSHSGSAVDYLCLSKNPLWGQYDESVTKYAFVYGAEYERIGNDAYYHDRDVPCAVCHTKRATTLMIPGRNQCYDGWTMEYSGYLSAGHHGHPAASQYVCLDETPDVMVDGQSDLDGVLFYSVGAVCGSLRCPPYVNGRKLTCVVCSK